MYCVNCGVKLSDGEKKCPLCATVVFHPDIPHPQGEKLYPADRMPIPQVNSRGLQIILTALFLIPILICLQCDLLVKGGITWSGYVTGALLTGYVVMVLPMWFRQAGKVLFCALDFLVAVVYLFYINAATGGSWFWTFALPVTVGIGAISTGLVALAGRRGRRLYVFGGALIALGGFMLMIENLLCLTFGLGFYGWSLYPLTVLGILGGMLIFLAVNRRAREKMEKRFFL